MEVGIYTWSSNDEVFAYFFEFRSVCGVAAGGLWRPVAACGGGGDLEGTYFPKMGEGPGEGVTMELKDDGVAVVTLPGVGSTQGTYTSEGNTLTVLLPGDTDVYIVGEDGNLTTTAMGETMVMVRQ